MREAHGDDRVPAVRLEHDGVDLRQVVLVFGDGETGAADDAVEFLLCFLLDGGVECHGEEEGHEGRDSLGEVSPIGKDGGWAKCPRGNDIRSKPGRRSERCMWDSRCRRQL